MLTTEENVKLFVEWYFEVEEDEQLISKRLGPTYALCVTDNKEIDIHADPDCEIVLYEQYTGVKKIYRLIDPVHFEKYERIG